MRVVGKQDECRKTGGTDGVALRDGLGGITDGIQGIGDGADLFVQFAHFSDTARVIGDRTVGVKRHNDTGHRQHRGRGNGNTVEASSSQ